MKPNKPISLLLCGILLLLLLAGCGPKAAGSWASTGTDSGTTVVLNKDGTGTMTEAPNPADQIKWTEDGSNIKIFHATDDPGSATAFITGTLSDDKKSMTLDVGGAGIATATFTRQ